jgi:hypothetical protein
MLVETTWATTLEVIAASIKSTTVIYSWAWSKKEILSAVPTNDQSFQSMCILLLDAQISVELGVKIECEKEIHIVHVNYAEPNYPHAKPDHFMPLIKIP